MPHLLSSDQRTDTTPVGPPAIDAPGWVTVCLNCHAPLGGPFCSQCGQRAVPPHPTTSELAGDAYGELAGWDGKFVQTIRLLLRRPGELTRALLDGQRARYISPVRLYVLCSVLYFIISAGAPPPNVEFDVGIGFGAGDAVQTPGEAALAKAVVNGLANLDLAERALAESEISAQPRIVQPMVRAMAVDYAAVSRRASEATPRALFVLIPALAAILGLFYQGRHYPEHLYFAIHFQTFVFIALALEALAGYGRSLPLLAIARVCATLWIVGYGILAQRRVYGGSWLATGFKAVGIAALYGLLWATTVIGVTLWASRAD